MRKNHILWDEIDTMLAETWENPETISVEEATAIDAEMLEIMRMSE